MIRERYIDIAKGWAILCIVFLHFEEGLLPGVINTFIGSFMVSMFYITTGWLDAQKQKPITIKDLVKKRWRQLGIPYLWWTLIILIFDCILWAFDYYDTYFITREIYKSITLRGIGTLWFLPALFGGEIIWHYVKRNRLILIAVLTFTLVYQYYYGVFFIGKTESIWRIIDAPFRTFNNMLGAWIGIAAGYVFYKILDALNFSSWKPLAILLTGLLKVRWHFALPTTYKSPYRCYGVMGRLYLGR